MKASVEIKCTSNKCNYNVMRRFNTIDIDYAFLMVLLGFLLRIDTICRPYFVDLDILEVCSSMRNHHKMSVTQISFLLLFFWFQVATSSELFENLSKLELNSGNFR